jgi:hypothetical protein
MSSVIDRTNEKRIAKGLSPIVLTPFVAPLRQPFVFEIREYLSKIHTLDDYIYPWDTQEGLKYLEMICRQMGFRGTTEEFTTIFYSIHPKN